jgi:hypothetical protein
VCADPACQELALARGSLRRALDVPIPDGLFGAVPAGGAADNVYHIDHEGGS